MISCFKVHNAQDIAEFDEKQAGHTPDSYLGECIVSLPTTSAHGQGLNVLNTKGAIVISENKHNIEVNIHLSENQSISVAENWTTVLKFLR